MPLVLTLSCVGSGVGRAGVSLLFIPTLSAIGYTTVACVCIVAPCLLQISGWCTCFAHTLARVLCRVVSHPCSLAQTVMVVDNSTPEARRALQKLPTLGTLSAKWEVLECMEEANSVVDLDENNQVVMLDTVHQICDIIRIADDATLQKLAGSKDAIVATVRSVWAKVADDIKADELELKMPEDQFFNEDRQADTEDWVKDLLEVHGPDAEAISDSLIAAIEETFESA